MTRYLKDVRDKNENDLCDLIIAIGGYFIKMDATAGFDLVVVFQNGTHLVEVKNPDKKWKLTPNEQKKKAAVEAVGGVYNVVENDEDILEIKER